MGRAISDRSARSSSRTSFSTRESTSVTIFRYGKRSDDRRKLLDGCEAFGCEPWVAVYVETEQAADFGAERELAHSNLRQQLNAPSASQARVWSEVERKAAIERKAVKRAAPCDRLRREIVLPLIQKRARLLTGARSDDKT